jgi:hypothetical protein
VAAFTQDPKTRNAAERCLERISEAARKLGGVAEELCPGIPWPQLRAVGNLLRHEYDSSRRIANPPQVNNLPHSLFVAQGNRRIDRHGAAGRDVAGGEGYG